MAASPPSALPAQPVRPIFPAWKVRMTTLLAGRIKVSSYDPSTPGRSDDDTFSGTNLDAFVAKYNLGGMGYSGKSD